MYIYLLSTDTLLLSTISLELAGNAAESYSIYDYFYDIVENVKLVLYHLLSFSLYCFILPPNMNTNTSASAFSHLASPCKARVKHDTTVSHNSGSVA
jgi:hypothetical protein